MIYKDSEFGEVVFRKNTLARSIKASVSASGKLTITAPRQVPDFFLKRFLQKNREIIREKLPVRDPTTQRAREAKERMLKKAAKEYLPYRLEYLAKKYGYRYEKCRLTHAETRWGSCSSRKTISLNVGLMNVPEKLRDYVIIHELAHLNHMDHSKEFWLEVEKHDPNYREHRRGLKSYCV